MVKNTVCLGVITFLIGTSLATATRTPDETLALVDQVCGQSTASSLYPWLVSIRHKDLDRTCAGSLVSTKHVVTSAYCLLHQKASDLSIRLGERDLSVSGNEVDVAIDRWVVHGKFDSDSLDHDIALIFLAQEVEFTEMIRPICIPRTAFDYEDYYVRATTLGYGITYYGETVLDSLQEVPLEILNHDQCESTYSDLELDIADNTICAANTGGDTCQGDTGAPLICSNPTTLRSELCGIVSFDINCLFNRYPGVYTRMAKYNNVIDDMIADDYHSRVNSGEKFGLGEAEPAEDEESADPWSGWTPLTPYSHTHELFSQLSSLPDEERFLACYKNNVLSRSTVNIDYDTGNEEHQKWRNKWILFKGKDLTQLMKAKFDSSLFRCKFAKMDEMLTLGPIPMKYALHAFPDFFFLQDSPVDSVECVGNRPWQEGEFAVRRHLFADGSVKIDIFDLNLDFKVDLIDKTTKLCKDMPAD